MEQDKIGRFIQSLRKEKNLTQQELADIIGVTDRAISKWENGRGLPDYSLLRPLSDALGISINELLNGERIKKEEKEKRYEDTIINTIRYSKKKIKNTKLIFGVILSLIIIFLITLITLFGIDITRMRNNKPVFFSTWGFKYAPPINIDDINIEKAIEEYLIEKDEKNNHYNNEKSFVAMRTYLIKEDLKDKYYVYSWILQEKYYQDGEKIIKDTGSSIPYKFELIKIDNEFLVNDYTIPRDGSYYTRDMKSIFPSSVLKDMNNIHTDGTIERLASKINDEVKLYFHE